ncbi:MAG: GNAT family N-acetyltransferase [Candidatus Hodarchaeales archaeon]|jgi:ribosomal protein S18 acetylase RimI-like enzyme
MVPSKELNAHITFRPLTVDDIDAIIVIDEKIVRRKRSPVFREKLHEQISCCSEDSYGAFLPDGKLVGYIIAETKVYIFGEEDLSAWIILLGVDPNYQDQGVGTALTKQTIDSFTQKGIKAIRTITAWNWGDLVEFFSSTGFNLSTYLTLELNIE